MTNGSYREYDPQQFPPPSGYPAPAHPEPYPPTRPVPADPYAGGPPYGQYQPYGPPPPPAGWPPPPPAPPARRRTGLIVGLVAGGLALVLCLVGIALVAVRVINEAGGAGSDDPFAGTPAADFAEGVDGIRLPEAAPVGDFTAEQVTDMLSQVRAALIASRLDPAMLLDRDPEPFLALMAEDNQPLLRDEFASADFRYFASQFADGAELAVPIPRVEGEITFEATRDEGGFRVIEVVTSFVWAYAFVVPEDDPELDGIVVVRDELVWQLAHEEDVADSSLGLWLWDGEAYAWGIDCNAFEQGLLSPQTEREPGGSEDPGEIFDPAGSLDVPSTC